MEALVAAAKVGKYATSESGDTLEMIERPSGGVSFVLADGSVLGNLPKRFRMSSRARPSASSPTA